MCNWDDEGITVRSNADIEEQFHITFGPWIRSDYHLQLEEMLSRIVTAANAGRTRDEWVMCSTVRMKFNTGTVYKAEHRTMLTIKTIFIRPCLQGSHTLGKILKYFASNTDANVGIAINDCYPMSKNAMNKWYGGENSEIFSVVAGNARGSGVKTYSYSLLLGDDRTYEKSKTLLLDLLGEDKTENPEAEILNERKMKDIPDVEWKWNALALINHKYGWRLNIVKYYFDIGIKSLEPITKRWAIRDAIERLEEIKTPSQEELDVVDWLKTDCTILDTDDIYTVNPAVLREYKELIAKMDANVFFDSCKKITDFSRQRRSGLKAIYSMNCLKKTIKILSSQELFVFSKPLGLLRNVDTSVQTQYVRYSDQKSDVQKFLDKEIRTHIELEDGLSYFLKTYYTSMSYRCDFDRRKIYFQTEYEDDRIEFLKICPDIIEKLRILSAGN